jgi:hypothetical protein
MQQNQQQQHQPLAVLLRMCKPVWVALHVVLVALQWLVMDHSPAGRRQRRFCSNVFSHHHA